MTPPPLLPIDTLLRLDADGELSPDQAAHLQAWQAKHPELADRVRQQMEGERRLRQRCSSLMTRVQVPMGLADQVRQVWLNEQSNEQNMVETGAEVAGRIGRANVAGEQPIQDVSAPHRRAASRRTGLMRFFVGPQHANALAVAATLALVVGAVLYGIFGRSIDDVPPPSAADVISEAAYFASAEHDRSSIPSDDLRKICKSTCPIDTREELASLMNCEVGDLPDLRCVGYEFKGWRQLKTPVRLPGPSAQLIYRKIADDNDHGRAPMVTLTLLPDRQDCGGGVCKDLTDGEWSAATGGASCSHKVLRSHDKTFVYLLVCCNEADMQAISSVVKQGGGCCAKSRSNQG